MVRRLLQNKMPFLLWTIMVQTLIESQQNSSNTYIHVYTSNAAEHTYIQNKIKHNKMPENKEFSHTRCVIIMKDEWGDEWGMKECVKVHSIQLWHHYSCRGVFIESRSCHTSSQFRVKSSTLIYSTGKPQVPSILRRIQTFNFLCADTRRQTHADIRGRMQTHAKFFSCILCPSCYSAVLFTHRNDIFHCYLHVNGLCCEFQLLYILAILKKPLCDVTDNIWCHRCAQWCQQTIRQLKLLIFKLSIS